MSSTIARADNQIIWQSIHFPPLTILRGEDKGQGQLDRFFPYLQQQLSQYQHQNVEMNWARTFKAIGKGDHICSTMVFKSAEREAIAKFTVPVAVALPIRVIMSKENLARLGATTSYSLVELMADKRFAGSLVNDRSYTPAIDKLLAEHEAVSNLSRKSIVSKSLLTMLKLGRVDYMLEYPATVSYLMKEDSQFKEAFSSVAIEEIPAFTLTYLACPNSPWGKQVVADINTVIINKHSADEYIDLLTQGYNHEEREVIRKGLQSSVTVTDSVSTQ
ncbi:MAG: TIGR02285 family protein [Pseudomonadales bacterium]